MKAAAATPGPPAGEVAGRPPNIVLILADDLGWNQVGYHGFPFFATPHLDRLARESVRFRHAYSAAPICSPSRAAILTGRAPARLQLTDYIPGRLFPDQPLVSPGTQRGLPLEETTLAEMLRTRGYRSGIFGKWHLADSYDYAPGRPLDPESQGFDEVFHTNKPKEDQLGTPDAHNADAITERAVDFVRRHRGRPFFCYIAHNVAHRPLTEDPAVVERWRRRPGAGEPGNSPVIAAMIERMDRGIGRILDVLRELDLERGTIVVFTSDNGNIVGDQGPTPFRGGKAMLWEGGLRVPLAIRWPGRIAPDRDSDEPVISHDLCPTLLELTGTTYAPRLHDGVSLGPILLGTAAALPREAIFWHYPHYHELGDRRPGAAIRMGRYKLIEWYEGTLLGRGPATSLFDVVADPGETRDLAAEMPGRNEAMLARLRAWRARVGAIEMRVR
ncbi:MAG: sulfatase [Verrucomicrobiota bacterium]